jgi:hypothetical protein
MYNQWLLPKILITYLMTKKVNWQLTQIIPNFPNWQHTYIIKRRPYELKICLACDRANGSFKRKVK